MGDDASNRILTSDVSICILTYNDFFYNRLAIEQIRKLTRITNYEVLVLDNGSTDGSAEWLRAQPDVTLFRLKGNVARHGWGLDFLVKKAKNPICCCLCSDAFPISPEWLTPAMYLGDDVFLSGIYRNASGRLSPYVCPSYLFGWTEWLKQHSFMDNWPKWDTGEKLSKDCFDEGHKIKTWKASDSSFQGPFTDKLCNYNDWVWHTWWGGRAQTVPRVVGVECETGYHDHVKKMSRARFQLDY